MEKDSSEISDALAATTNTTTSGNNTPNNNGSYIAPPNSSRDKDKKKRVWGIFGKKAKKVFGTPLCELDCYEHTRIPVLPVHTIEYLKAFGLDAEGLFRIPGSQKFINEMKAEYDSTGGRQGILPGSDVHAVSGLLKQFLRDLPEPLLTYELYPLLIAAQTQREMIGRLCALREQLRQLPEANRDLLKYLLEFLILPKDADGMRLIEDTPHVNRITQTLIDEYDFMMNEADLPVCILGGDSGWTKRSSKNKKGTGRAKSDPVRPPLNVNHGLKSSACLEREALSARTEGTMPVAPGSGGQGSIRRKRGEDGDTIERQGEDEDEEDDQQECQEEEGEGEDEEGREVEGEPYEDDGEIDEELEEEQEAQVRGPGSEIVRTATSASAKGPKRRSWSSNVKSKAKRVAEEELNPLGPTTSSVARMKALIAKANAEKELGRQRSVSENFEEASAVLPPSAAGDKAPFRPPEYTKRGASYSDLMTAAAAQASEKALTEQNERTIGKKGGSRLFGLKSKPGKEKEKNERKERQREKKEEREREKEREKEEREREKEREKEETIALLFDRLRLWREREKVPENVQCMNIKQLKAEKRWLKKELNSLDSKREREELRPLHLRRKELSFYLARMKKDKAGAVFASSSAAIQSYSALLKDARMSPAPTPLSCSPPSPDSLSAQGRTHSPPTSPPLSPITSPRRERTVALVEPVNEPASISTASSLNSSAGLRSKWAREGSVDTGLVRKNGVVSHTKPGHVRSKSFIFRQPPVQRGKDNGTGSPSTKKRKDSKVVIDSITISSPTPIDQPQQKRGKDDPDKRKSAENSAKRKSASKPTDETATKRRSGFMEPEVNGCSRENLGELSIAAKPDHIPV